MVRVTSEREREIRVGDSSVSPLNKALRLKLLLLSSESLTNLEIREGKRNEMKNSLVQRSKR